MRRSTICAAVCLVVMVALGGCSVSVPGVAAPDPAAAVAAPPTAAGPVAGGDLYSDAGGRFAIAAPPGWRADTSGTQGTAVVFLDPTPTRSAEGAFSANINVLVVPSGAGLPATVAGARQELRGLADYAATTDEDAVLGDGTPAHLLGGTFTDKGSGFRLRNLQLFTVHGSSTTVVTGTAPIDAWGSYATVFDTALRTLLVST